MERGLLVELSPNEETVLHRIAQGMMLTADMEPHHLGRLKQLALIEERGTDFRLTDLGRHRLATRGAAHRTSPSDKPGREVPEPDSLGG
jgi:predicted transcriptional regulator